MKTRSAVLLAAAVVAAASAAPAEAKHRKPLSGAYDVVIPVPHPVEDGAHCVGGVDGLSRHATKVTLPETGELKIDVTGFVGDWVLEVFDAKGRVLATGAELDPTKGTRAAKWRKKKAPTETVSIVVCNYGGSPAGHVAWTYAFSR